MSLTGQQHILLIRASRFCGWIRDLLRHFPETFASVTSTLNMKSQRVPEVLALQTKAKTWLLSALLWSYSSLDILNERHTLLTNWPTNIRSIPRAAPGRRMKACLYLFWRITERRRGRHLIHLVNRKLFFFNRCWRALVP